MPRKSKPTTPLRTTTAHESRPQAMNRKLPDGEVARLAAVFLRRRESAYAAGERVGFWLATWYSTPRFGSGLRPQERP